VCEEAGDECFEGERELLRYSMADGGILLGGKLRLWKEEGVQELECARDKCVRDAEANLVNTASDFEDQLMDIYWDVVAKADVKVEEILNGLAVKVHVLQGKTVRGANTRAKGGYRGMGTRYLLR
jgi:hypothetical protein